MPDIDPRTELARELYEAAYQDESQAWRETQVAFVEKRIAMAKDGEPSTASGARKVSDAELKNAAPKRGRRRRIAALVTIGVLAVAAVVLGIVERHWIAVAAINPIGIGVLIGATAATGAATVVSYVRVRRKRILSCRVRIDTPFSMDKGEPLRLQGENKTVTNPSVVVARIKNTGGAQITPDDYISPLALRFPGRTVISVDTAEFEPEKLGNVLAALPDFAIDGERVKLPRMDLERGHSFKLVIVLSGPDAGETQDVEVEGGIRDGRITTREGREKIRPETLFWGGLTALSAGALAVVLLLNNVTPFPKLPPDVACVPSSLTVAGSSAFGRAAAELSGSYRVYCPAASIKVQTPGSLEGLRRLADAAGNRGGQLALSDGRVDDPQFAKLVPDRLAIVPFTFVVSKNVPINTLSVADARRIFTGEAHFWRDITGNPRDTGEIRVVGRTASSGTRRTLERYVLGSPGAPGAQAQATSDSCRDRRAGVPADRPIVCEQGSTANLTDQVGAQNDAIGYADVSDVEQSEQSAGVKRISLDGRDATLDDIRAGYPFWTVEYVYSYGQPETGSLAAAFKNYLATPEARTAMESFQYHSCADDLQDLCARR